LEHGLVGNAPGIDAMLRHGFRVDERLSAALTQEDVPLLPTPVAGMGETRAIAFFSQDLLNAGDVELRAISHTEPPIEGGIDAGGVRDEGLATGGHGAAEVFEHHA